MSEDKLFKVELGEITKEDFENEKIRLYEEGKKLGRAWAKKPFHSKTVQKYLNLQTAINLAVKSIKILEVK
jgi:hypothetical protein